SPVQIGSADNWVIVTAGDAYTLGIKSDGTLWAWGHNGEGQLGDGTTTNRTSPVQMGNAHDWTSVGVGGLGAHNLVLKSDGTLWTWGKNSAGQLGDGTTVNKASPVLSRNAAEEW